MTDKPRLPSIAVVAVHGIGDQKPGSSARAVADLLMRLRTGTAGQETAAYSSFSERRVRVPVHPAKVGEGSKPPMKESDRPRSVFHDQSAFLRGVYRGDIVPDDAAFSPTHQMMREQLEEYESSGEPYETIRLDGQRLGESGPWGAGEPHARIHIYEMYWADLSRLRVRFLTVFAELYQLFFHVAHLGRLAIDQARLEHPRDAGWQRYQRAHELAVKILTLITPVLFLTTLASAAGLAAIGVPQAAKPYVVTALASLAVAVGAAMIAYRGTLMRSLAAWFLVPVLTIAAWRFTWLWVAGERVGTASGHAIHIDRAILAAWVVLSGLLLFPVYRAYNRRQRGALRLGLGASALAAAGLGAVILFAGSSAELRNGILNVFEIEMFAVVLFWGVLYAAGASSALYGWYLPLKLAGAARDRARRVAWTARTTLVISASSVLTLSFVLWAALLALYRDRLPRESPRLVFEFFGPGDSYAAVFDKVISVTAGPGMPLVLLVAGVVFALSALALFPAVMQEVRPPDVGARFRDHDRPPPAAGGEAEWRRQEDEGTMAERLGVWMSTGLGVAGAGLSVLYVAVFFVMPAAVLVQLATGGNLALLAALQESAAAVIVRTGALVAGLQVGAIAISSWLDTSALGFRTMLDALLDVDSYMRQEPRSGTPRARIAERFASLMRFIANRREDDEPPYKAIIFVTHSQGTVITVDMLNFLLCEPDDEIDLNKGQERGEPPPFAMQRMYMMTMGSPLRELYARAFPHLYGWVKGDHAPWTGAPRSGYVRDKTRTLDEHGGGAAGRRVALPAIDIDASPDPYALGLARWVNAYRSGDYVGRALWRPDLPDTKAWGLRCAPADARTRYPDDQAPIIFVSEDAVSSRRELCIGAGAHTHYWDSTARAVASELDMLIAEAYGTVTLPPHGGRIAAIQEVG